MKSYKVGYLIGCQGIDPGHHTRSAGACPLRMTKFPSVICRSTAMI